MRKSSEKIISMSEGVRYAIVVTLMLVSAFVLFKAWKRIVSFKLFVPGTAQYVYETVSSKTGKERNTALSLQAGVVETLKAFKDFFDADKLLWP